MRDSTDLLPKPLCALYTTDVILKFYGQQGSLLADPTRTEALCRPYSCPPPYLILVPANSNGRARIARESGLTSLLHEEVVFPLKADGVELPRSGGAVVMSTRDCPSVVLVNRRNRKVVVLHAGRDQLLRPDGGNFIADGLMAIDDKDGGRDAVVAYVFGGIGAQHFAHDQCPEKVRPFFERFGASVFHKRSTERWQLDLTEVLYRLLTASGIPLTNIHVDGRCTFTDPALGSRRAESAGIQNKKEANWTIVMRTPFD